MGSVVIPVARLVMSVCEDGQCALGVRRGELGFRPCTMQRLFRSVDLEIEAVLLHAADALSAGVTAAAIRINYSMIRHLVDTDFG
jgi:hypothetical protein